MQAIEIENLQKAYGEVQAVAGVSFEVHPKEIFGMVGPNGAGKTTTIECLEGLRRADSGRVLVLGLDPQRRGYELRQRIGVQLQEGSLPDRLRVGEAMEIFASFYRKPVEWRPLVELLGLADKFKSPFGKLSGGQKQRLLIGLALVNDPELVFLDELTTGLDPQARRAMWDMVKGIRDRGKTVFLTTHYMEEAEHLCDRVAIIDHWKIVALDSPQNLVASLDAENRVVFSVKEKVDEAVFRKIPGVTRVEQSQDRVIIYGRGDGLLVKVVMAFETGHIRFRDLRTEQPSLDDVFIALTGKEMRD
jgi:ABC-2 type transport system ATP-binding protein